MNNLPEYCYYTSLMTKKTVKLIRGVMGYVPIDTDKTADELNEELGVTEAQAGAMSFGSMFGWHVPGANPDEHMEVIIK